MTSDLSYIEIKHPSNPSLLFHEWQEEAKKCGIHTFFINLATATRAGKVSNRTVVVREVMEDSSLAFCAQAKSSKIKDITENPEVAATLLLIYTNGSQRMSRQVRFVGAAEKLSEEQCKMYFAQERLSDKIRSHICQECSAVEWKELKAKHNALLHDVVEKNKELEMPNTQVAYKIVPHTMEFYSSVDGNIADRVLFKLDGGLKWKCEHVMA